MWKLFSKKKTPKRAKAAYQRARTTGKQQFQRLAPDTQALIRQQSQQAKQMAQQAAMQGLQSGLAAVQSRVMPSLQSGLAAVQSRVMPSLPPFFPTTVQPTMPVQQIAKAQQLQQCINLINQYKAQRLTM